MPVEAQGDVSAGFENIADVFEGVLSRCNGRGAALHIRVEGVPVVDLWGGMATGTREWEADSSSVIFSCTKGLLSILIAQLAQEGRLDLDGLVSDYWPEFATTEKASTTVRMLLAHRAGLPFVREDLQLSDVLNFDVMTSVLARERPFFEPGSRHCYHALTFGWLVGELIRRLTGMSVGAAFQERIATPLAAAAWIGVPIVELERAAALYCAPGTFDPDPSEAGVDPTVGGSEMMAYADRAMTFGHALASDPTDDVNGYNNTDVRRAEIPGANGIASAKALATVWSATVSNHEKARLINDDIARDMTAVRSEGRPAVFGPGPWHRWGSGFMLHSDARPFLTDESFGHDGLGGQVAFADPRYQVGFGFISNDLQVGDTRAQDLVLALRATLE